MFELKKKQFVGQVNCNIVMVNLIGNGLNNKVYTRLYPSYRQAITDLRGV